MFHRFILTVFFLFFSASSFANCKGVWELKALAASQEQQTLLSENNYQFAFAADFLGALDSIHQKIDRASGVETRLLLCNSDDPNVFAWKEGDQNISSLTLGLTTRLGNDYAAYAAVLAHQNAHLVKNHTSKLRVSNIGYGAASFATGVGIVVAGRGHGGAELATQMSSISSEAFAKVYSPEQEAEADQLALQYLQGAGFGADGVVRLHENLESSGKYFKTHPISSSKTAELKALVQPLPVPVLLPPLKNTKSSFATVVTAKSQHGYYIAKQTGDEVAAPGMHVAITYEDGVQLVGTVKEVSAGYFSVMPANPFAKNIEGASVSKWN
jgi:predicted Zn-dependent protease